MCIFLAACGGGGSPTNPTPTQTSTPPADEIIITAAPASGTLTLRDCPAGNVTPLCTQQLVLTSTASFNRAVSQASIFYEFYTAAGLRCAIGISTPKVDMAARSRTVMTAAVMFGSLPPDAGQFCATPFTTTRVVGYLVEGSSSRIMTREIAANFNWVLAAGSGGTGGAPGGGGAPNPNPTPRPTPTPTPAPPGGGFAVCPGSPPNASCGRATGRCNNNQYTCSQNRSGTCSSNGGLACVFCPGPLC